MPYLKELKKNNVSYYYLYHTIREGNKYKKVSKYIGKIKPTNTELNKLKAKFLLNLKQINVKKDINKSNLISILQTIQEKKGYLPIEELEKLSREQKIPGTEIFSVASFYSQFKTQKPPKHIISVCTGTACHVKGSNLLVKFLSENLVIKPNETTKNGLIKLETVNCIGACAKAPAVTINNKVYGNVTNNNLKNNISNLK
jgi:NADH:ubiquinone oxidoreductase subunit E